MLRVKESKKKIQNREVINMKEDIILKVILTLLGILFIIAMLMVVTLIVAYVYALTKYGNVPISELPTWAWWLLKGE